MSRRHSPRGGGRAGGPPAGSSPAGSSAALGRASNTSSKGRARGEAFPQPRWPVRKGLLALCLAPKGQPVPGALRTKPLWVRHPEPCLVRASVSGAVVVSALQRGDGSAQRRGDLCRSDRVQGAQARPHSASGHSTLTGSAVTWGPFPPARGHTVPPHLSRVMAVASLSPCMSLGQPCARLPEPRPLTRMSHLFTGNTSSVCPPPPSWLPRRSSPPSCSPLGQVVTSRAAAGPLLPTVPLTVGKPPLSPAWTPATPSAAGLGEGTRLSH